MQSLQHAATDFLAHRRLAVAGVSRKDDTAANGIYRRLRDAGYRVFPLNPYTDTVEGDPCYPSVGAVPGGVDGVVIATHPDAAPEVVRECAAYGVPRVWLHRSFGAGSLSREAVELARREGIAVIDGGCPLMFLEPVDLGHRCIRWLLNARGRLPDGRAYADAHPDAHADAHSDARRE